MAEKSSKFQTIVLILSAAFGVIGLIMFALSRGGDSISSTPLDFWGFVEEKKFEEIVRDLDREGIDISNVTYTEVSRENFGDEIVEAIASGTAPDIVMFPVDEIIKNENKLKTIPFELYDIREYRNDFIEAGEAFVRPDGILAVPFQVDPLILYWNRSIFNNKGISLPPKIWDEVVELVKIITEVDSLGNISLSTIALGEYRNLENAREIITTLIFQAGNPIVQRGTNQSGEFENRIILKDRLGFAQNPAEAAVNFFTQFSDFSKDVYTWNRSLSNSKENFIAGTVAMYIGFASERSEIQRLNPNLNFDVSLLPQRSLNSRITYGDLVGLAIVRDSVNGADALNVIKILSGAAVQEMMLVDSDLPSVRRDILSQRPSDPFKIIANDSAIAAKAFIDPNKEETDAIFQQMIETVTSGAESASNVITDADARLKDLLR